MVINYFEGEKIKIKSKPNKAGLIVTEEEINNKYLQGKVRIVTEQARYPLNSILQLLKNGDYTLHPEFQRRRRWNRVKQSQLIESFIMNVPIPPIFLYEQDLAKYEVMDGLQRLTAISEFYQDKYKLEGLEFWPELNGYKYSTLPKSVKQGIDRRYLSSIILLHETAEDEDDAKRMKQLVFDRINSGGAKLEYQESRNALYHGDFVIMAEKLARDDVFCSIFDIPCVTDEELQTGEISEELAENQMYQKMDDVEMVIRFFAMRYVESYEGLSLKEFFDKFTEQGNLLPSTVLEEYEKIFLETIRLAYSIYGSDTFCLWKQYSKNKEWYLSKQPAKVLYDPIMYVLSQKLNYGARLVQSKDEIIKETEQVVKEMNEIFNGRKTTKYDIIKRIDIFESIFNKYL